MEFGGFGENGYVWGWGRILVKITLATYGEYTHVLGGVAGIGSWWSLKEECKNLKHISE